MRYIALALLVSVMASGCAIGQKTNYHEGTTDLAGFTDNKANKLYIGFYEERPYVLSGDKDPSFTGLVRSLYGIPYSRHTESGKPLHADLTGLMIRSLSEQGYDVAPVEFDLREEIKPVLLSTMKAGSSAMIYRLREWKTDSMHREVFIYDVTLEVYDTSAKKLASTVESGRRRVNREFTLGDAIKELLDKMNNAASIRSVLNSS